MLDNPKIEVLFNSVVTEAFGNEKGNLGGLRLKNTVTGEESSIDVSGLFFAIGHDPATKFLDGQVVYVWRGVGGRSDWVCRAPV